MYKGNSTIKLIKNIHFSLIKLWSIEFFTNAKYENSEILFMHLIKIFKDNKHYNRILEKIFKEITSQFLIQQDIVTF